MSYSIQRAVSDGSMVLLPISIEYFDRSEISVLFDGVVDARQWAWVGTTDTAISFTPAVANLVEVSVRRTTDISVPRHQFSQGALFTTESLDDDIRQVLHIAQEAKEGSGIGEVYQNLNFHGFKAINMGNGSDPGDAVNHAQMQVHDGVIVGYMNAADASADAAAASAVAAAASAASIDPVQFPTSDIPDTIPMSNPTGNGWLYKTITQLKGLLGLGTAAYTDSTTYQSYDADIPTVAASQVEMEVGAETALRSMSPLRVKQAVVALAPGVGQTWQNMLGSRAAGTNYTNSTGKPIVVIATFGNSGVAFNAQFTINGTQIVTCYYYTGVGGCGAIIVPDGATYSTSGATLSSWWELRS